MQFFPASKFLDILNLSTDLWAPQTPGEGSQLLGVVHVSWTEWGQERDWGGPPQGRGLEEETLTHLLQAWGQVTGLLPRLGLVTPQTLVPFLCHSGE